MKAVLRAARAAVSRRRLQTAIIGMVVLLTAATSVIALGLLVVSHAPFDSAFGRAAGAHLSVSVDASVPAAVAAATGPAAGATATAGPYDTVSAGMKSANGFVLPTATLAGRSDRSGSIDRLGLDAGTWLTGPGQIVLSRDYAGPLSEPGNLGQTVTLDVPGNPTLTLVGIADSVTGSADGWVWPTDAAVLAAPTGRQMLYRFADASSHSVLSHHLAAVTAALPAGAVTGATQWLAVRDAANRSISAFVPFVVAFAVLGLILSVLITANVVNGAVVAGFRTIGVLKTLGFTPFQVVAAYVAQVLVPALVGCAAGVVGGVLLAAPLLADERRAYDLPTSVAGVPAWVIALVAVAAPLLVALAAVGPAVRAGRLAATEAISVGRAPRAGRGFRLRRALTATRLPRSVAFGLGMPLARPARAVGTVVAIMLGAVTLVFAVGLTSSLSRVQQGFGRIGAVPVVVELGGANLKFIPKPGQAPPPGPKPADPAATRATVAAQPGTAHVAMVSYLDGKITGITPPVTVEAYDGDASWTGHLLIDGRWYTGPDEVLASSYLLRETGHRVGDRITITGKGGSRTVTITGSFLDNGDDYRLIASAATTSGVLTDPGEQRLEVGLAAGTDPGAYTRSLQDKLGADGPYVDDRTQGANNRTFLVLDVLIGTLSALLCAVAALGVVNTVVLNTRERVHDIGVLKAVGMTPRQLRTMVISSMVGVGLLAGAVAVPLGVALQRAILPAMGAAAGTDLPRSVIDVYGPAELAGLGAIGIVLAVVGALLPAGWAARIRPARALRAE